MVGTMELGEMEAGGRSGGGRGARNLDTSSKPLTYDHAHAHFNTDRHTDIQTDW